LIRQGIRTGLGTDGSASNNNLDMFGEMDTAAKLHKAIRNNPTVMNARTVLSMATLNGAESIGLSHVTGSLEPGKKADLIIVDTAKPHLQPMYHPVSQIVYSATGADVRDVIVNGSLVVENREIKTLDIQEILKEIGIFSKTVIKNEGRA
jgi:5-methylthioadenosine/S-adenosylhomocysteine deaminase